jgi:cation diffusion facilitator family transporter
MAGHDSAKAVVAAFTANTGIAIAKFTAFAFTGSASMLSEGIHSVADAGNQLLLLLGRKKARHPPDERRPFGYASERYFYAFIVAFVLFTLGGLFSVYEGIEKIRHPHEPESLWWAVGVLVFAIGIELWSMHTAVVEARPHKRKGQSWWGFIRQTKNPELPVVLLEDLGALIGLVIALFGVSMAKVTGNGSWDGVGSLGIGILLIVIAVVLVIEMGSLLIGEGAYPDDVKRMRAAIEAHASVKRLIHLRTEVLGPDDLVVAVKAEFDADLSSAELCQAINDVEAEIRKVEPAARLLFIEPDIYRAEATT